MRYVILLILIVLSFSRLKKNIVAFRIVSVLYALFIGMRYGQGLDYFSYGHTYMSQPTFFDIVTGSKSLYPTFFEPGYNILVSIFRQLSVPYEGFVFVISVGIVYGLYKFIVKYSENYMLSFMALYACYGIMIVESAYRQVIAMTLLVVAVPFLERKKYVQAIIIMCLATSFHVTAAVLCLVFIVFYIDRIFEIFEKYWMKIILGIVLPCALIINFIGLHNILTILSLPDFIASKANFYLGVPSPYSIVALGYRILLFLVIMIALKVCEYNKTTKRFMYLMIIGYCVYFTIARFPILSRVTMYFELFEIVVVPTLLYSAWKYFEENAKLQKAVVAFGTAGYMMVLTLLFLNDINFVNEAGYYEEAHTPYISIFNQDEIENHIDISTNIYYPGFMHMRGR